MFKNVYTVAYTFGRILSNVQKNVEVKLVTLQKILFFQVQKSLKLMVINKIDTFMNNDKLFTLQNLVKNLLVTKCIKGVFLNKIYIYTFYFYFIGNSETFLSLNFATKSKPASRAISYALGIPKPILSA